MSELIIDVSSHQNTINFEKIFITGEDGYNFTTNEGHNQMNRSRYVRDRMKSGYTHTHGCLAAIVPKE